jgi:EAL domain-containing protein (putative c-di-GMP-specific phosphodiesterase class I)
VAGGGAGLLSVFPAVNSADLRPVLSELIRNGEVVPDYQPIVDLYLGRPFGYELLSRAPGLFASATEMFLAARIHGLLADLEKACCRAALRSIGELGSANHDCRFFVNISPNLVMDPDCLRILSLADPWRHGHKKLVLEVTEKDSIIDRSRFEESAKICAEAGFELALDDFGAGHSGLLSLISCAPHFLKLDMEIVRQVDKDVYRQNLVKSLVALASSVDARLIAEGVETWGELRTLLAPGVRYAQGFALAYPGAVPGQLAGETRQRLQVLFHECHSPKRLLEDSIASRNTTIAMGS